MSNALFGEGVTQRSRLANSLYAAASKINHTFHPGHRRYREFMAKTSFAPWWVPEAVMWLEKNIHPGMRAFEWGAGRSTVWLSRRGVDITSVELDPYWSQWVRDYTRAAHIILTERKEEGYASFIAEGAPYDLIVVDGFYRKYCLLKARQAIKSGGIIVVDNADDAIVRSVIKHWPDPIASFDNGVDRTSFYRG